MPSKNQSFIQTMHTARASSKVFLAPTKDCVVAKDYPNWSLEDIRKKMKNINRTKENRGITTLITSKDLRIINNLFKENITPIVNKPPRRATG